MAKKKELAAVAPEKQIVEKILETVSAIPASTEPQSASPLERARAIGGSAAWRAASISGALAIPPGPLGLLTVIPDLVAIWQVQRKMVTDIAAAYGKTALLGPEQMLFCLSASQAVKDLVVRAGERILVRRVSLQAIQKILNRLGIVVSQRVAGRAISRWIPLVGAVGIGAYAYYDTASVAKTTMELFQKDLHTPAAQIKKKVPQRVKPRKARGDAAS